MTGSIELKIRDTFHSGKYGENFPKNIDMYVKNGGRTLGPFVLDMYHCTMFIPEVTEMADKAVFAFPDIKDYKIENPKDDDIHMVFPFIIGVIHAIFKRKNFNVETDYPVGDFYEEGMIEEAIAAIEGEMDDEW